MDRHRARQAQCRRHPRDHQAGADFRIQDLWLASQAIQRDFTLLTGNAKDFKDVPGLKFVVVKVP